MEIFSQEQRKRESTRLKKDRTLLLAQEKPQRTFSSPTLVSHKELRELIEIIQETPPTPNEREYTGSFIPNESFASRSITPSPSLSPRVKKILVKEDSPVKRKVLQQEIDDLVSFVEDGNFSDDPFQSQFDDDKMLGDAPEDLTDTDETDSDVEIESDCEEKEEVIEHSLNPFQLERTKTTDFLPKKRDYQPPLRCLVLEVKVEQFFSTTNGNNNHNNNTNIGNENPQKISEFSTPEGSQKILRVFDENRIMEKLIYLRGGWTDTIIEVGDYINIISWSLTHEELLDETAIIITNKQNAIIVHPDILIPVKSISASIRCSRQAVLSQQVRPGSCITEQILIGEITHLLFEKAMLHKNFSIAFLETHLNEILIDNLLKIFILEKDINYFKNLIQPALFSMQQWASANVHGIAVSLQRSSSMMSLTEQSAKKSVRKILAVEESIWSPLYGMKGKIDATVVFHNPPLSAGWRDNRLTTVPLELKTGRLRGVVGNTSDRAQVSLYSLLFSERELNHILGKSNFPEGLLCYINKESKSLINVKTSLNEMHGLIQRRNELASFLNQKQVLPPMVKTDRICSFCNQQNICMVYHKTLEKGNTSTSGVSKIFQENTEHISKLHSDFLLLWDKYIALEEEHSQSLSSAVWNFPSEQQSELGLCAGQMKLVSSQSVKLNTPSPYSASQQNNTGNDKNTSLFTSTGFVYRFEKQKNFIRSPAGTARTFSSSFLPTQQGNTKSLLDLSFNIGDYILLSTENGHFGVRQGIIKKITQTWIDVVLDEPLQFPYYTSPIELSLSQKTSSSPITDIEDLMQPSQNSETLWRLDKLDSMSIFGRMRWNLFQLLQNNEISTKWRELIIEERSPTFKCIDAPCDEFIESWSQQFPSISKLNIHQRNSIKHVLAANDYALILGMPGTGKTTTIAHIVATLVNQGKRILLTSYTHSAIDNLLLKLLDLNISFLRLGKENRIHPDILPYTLQKQKKLDKLVEKLQQQQVIATTCLGVNDIVLRNLTFDYCIIDEASQISLPVCLGPLYFAKTFVLVGDHYQLPPIIKSPEALESGEYESLFKKLSEKHPNSVVQLGIQYRMNKEIMSISNELVYNHRLKCGSIEVEKQRLSLPTISKIPSPSTKSNHWLLNVILADHPVIFVNLDKVPALEINKEHTITNPVEARMTAIVSINIIILK